VLTPGAIALLLSCSEESQVLLARLMSGYGRDASLNAKERKAPGTASITQLPGSPSASRGSNIGSEALDGEQTRTAAYCSSSAVPVQLLDTRQQEQPLADGVCMCLCWKAGCISKSSLAAA
jgi:hypothetical protein